MKIAAYPLLILFFLSQPGIQKDSSEVTDQRPGKINSEFATHRLWSKGGIGMVNKHLDVVVKSTSDEKNEIIVKPMPETEERWFGKRIDKP